MFFTTGENMPEGMGFRTFDATHLTWLVAGVLVCAAACMMFRRLPEQKRKLTLKILGGYMIFQEILKDLVLILLGEIAWAHLPFHLCGINILLIGFDVFRQAKTVRSFLYYFAIPGAALALIFPNWTDTPAFNFFHIHSFTIHFLLVLYPLLLVTTGQVDTDLRSALRGVGLLLAMAVPVYFLNLLWDTNFMFLMYAEPGTPFVFFEETLGHYLTGFFILVPAVLIVMMLPILLADARNKRAVRT